MNVITCHEKKNPSVFFFKYPYFSMKWGLLNLATVSSFDKGSHLLNFSTL